MTVVRKGNKIAIAADSQSTFGDTRMTSVDDAAWNKIFYSHNTYFTISGSAAHDLVLQSLLAKMPALDFSSRAKIFESFRLLHPHLKEEFYLRTEEDEEDPYESSQMVMLLANAHGIFSVFSLREVYEYQRFWAIGSGESYAMGAMHAIYDAPEIEAESIAKTGVAAGCHFDIHSAMPLTSYSIECNHA
jgi:ATP-dependent protease HslVU (ClpYQ) peptidase subunit